jgi:hypothetical protein
LKTHPKDLVEQVILRWYSQDYIYNGLLLLLVRLLFNCQLSIVLGRVINNSSHISSAVIYLLAIMAQDRGLDNGPQALLAHALTIDETRDQLETNLEDGLARSQIASRAEKWGRNELDDGPGVQPVKILVHQIANAMILVMRSTTPFQRVGHLI